MTMLMFEDQLPETMTPDQYDRWHAQSELVDGVRMGPLVLIADGYIMVPSRGWLANRPGNWSNGAWGLTAGLSMSGPVLKLWFNDHNVRANSLPMTFRSFEDADAWIAQHRGEYEAEQAA